MNNNGSLPLEGFDMMDAVKTYLTGIWAWFYLCIQSVLPHDMGECGQFCNIIVAILSMVLICVRIYNDLFYKWGIRKSKKNDLG